MYVAPATSNTFPGVAERLVDHGYSPIPISLPQGGGPSPGKKPVYTGWTDYCDRVPTDEELAGWIRACPNNGAGIACGAVVAIDIDIKDAQLAFEAEQLTREHLGDTPLLRFGQRPKRLLVYRAADDIPVAHYRLLKIDIIGDGGQFVAFGTHPGTGRPYEWPIESPLDVPVEDLLAVTQAQVDDLVLAIAKKTPDADKTTVGTRRRGGGPTERHGIVRDIDGMVTDGREQWLADIVHSALCDTVRAGDAITSDGIGAAAWTHFRATTDTSRPREDGKRWAWADAVTKAIAIVKKYKRGDLKIPVAEPHFPAQALAPKDARERLDALIGDWLDTALDPEASETPQLGIKAAAGLGKTTAVVTALASRDLADRHLEMYVPTNALGDELAGKLRTAAPHLTVLQIRGRGYEIGDDETMCAKAEIATEIARAGLRVGDTLCRREDDAGVVEKCEYYDTCPYIKQFADERPAVRIMAHEYLPLPRGKLPEPDLVVIDERCWPTAVRTASFNIDRLTRPRAVVGNVEGANDCQVVGRTVAEAMQDGRPALAELRRQNVDAKLLRELAKAEVGAVGQVPVSPDMPFAEQRRLLKNYRRVAAFKLARMWRLFADEMEFDGRDEAVRVQLRHNDKTIANTEPHDRVYLHYARKLDRVSNKPVLLIDADLDDVIATKLLPKMAVERLPVERLAEVIQVFDTACSNRRLLGTTDPEEMARAARRLADVRALIDREAYGGARVLVVATKKVAERLVAPRGGHITWFGNLRGKDIWKDHDTVIVAGRLQFPPHAVEDAMRALFWDREEPLRFVQPDENVNYMLSPQRRGYRLRKEFGDALVTVHPDPDGQRILEQFRENEIAQAIDRLRLVHAETPKRVILLSSVVIDATVDKLVRWNDLTPRRLERAFIRDGAVPFSATELARCFPDLWVTPQAATNDVIRRKLNSAVSLVSTLLGKRHYLITARYRRKSQRGRASRALIDGNAGEHGAKAALEAVVGPVSSFEITAIHGEPNTAPEADRPAPAGERRCQSSARTSSQPEPAAPSSSDTSSGRVRPPDINPADDAPEIF